MRKNMYWLLFQIACGLFCLFSWTQPGQAARYLLLGILFLRITLFLLVWKNGDRAVRWLAGPAHAGGRSGTEGASRGTF